MDFVFGLARNPRLERRIERQMRRSRSRCAAGEPSRRFTGFGHRTLSTWSRRAAAKAEALPGPRGDNPRFAVTSLPGSEFDNRALYEYLYCARGDMENRIKEQQLELFADRTSTATMRANQLRVSVRRIRLSLSSAHPCRGLFRRAVKALRLAAAARASPQPPRRPPEPPKPRAGEAGAMGETCAAAPEPDDGPEGCRMPGLPVW